MELFFTKGIWSNGRRSTCCVGGEVRGFRACLGLFSLFFTLFAVRSFPSLSPDVDVRWTALTRYTARFPRSKRECDVTRFVKFRMKACQQVRRASRYPFTTFSVFCNDLHCCTTAAKARRKGCAIFDVVVVVDPYNGSKGRVKINCRCSAFRFFRAFCPICAHGVGMFLFYFRCSSLLCGISSRLQDLFMPLFW